MRLIMTSLLCLSLLFQSVVFAQASQMGCDDHGAFSSNTGQVMSTDDSCCADTGTGHGSKPCQSEMGCHAFACVLTDPYLMPQAAPVSLMQPTIDAGLQSHDLTEVWRPPTSA